MKWILLSVSTLALTLVSAEQQALPADRDPVIGVNSDSGHWTVLVTTTTNFAPPRAESTLPSTRAIEERMRRAVSDFLSLGAWLAGQTPEKGSVRPVEARKHRQSGTGAPKPSQDVSEALRCIRSHESDTAGGYGAVSSNGKWRGAYQFVQPTWDATVRRMGRPDLVGIDPATAAPSDQDAAAAWLLTRSGAQHWSTTARKCGLL